MKQRRDEQRFEAMFRAHYRQVAAYALRRTTPEDAAEVVALTFTTAWRRLGVVPTDEGTLPWLLATARRVLANERRRHARHAALVQRLTAQFGRVSAGRTLPVDEEAVGARQAFDRLSTADREVLGLVGWDGLTTSELAVVLGITPNAARVRLHRARARFAAALDEGMIGDPVTRPTAAEARNRPGEPAGKEGGHRAK